MTVRRGREGSTVDTRAAVSVIMPGHDEVHTVGTILEHVLRRPVVRDVIVVDDASGRVGSAWPLRVGSDGADSRQTRGDEQAFGRVIAAGRAPAWQRNGRSHRRVPPDEMWELPGRTLVREATPSRSTTSRAGVEAPVLSSLGCETAETGGARCT